MEKLLNYLDASIKKRIDTLNETVENPPEIIDKIIDIQAKVEYLKTVLPVEYYQLVLEIDDNYGRLLLHAEDTYYRNGFVDGMQLQMEINSLMKGGDCSSKEN